MRIIKKINTSAVLCVDDDGRQLIALGKGLGFKQMGEELGFKDIQRTFYDIEPQFIDLVQELPPAIAELAAHVIDVYSSVSGHRMNPNAAFILADHISFAIERTKKGLKLGFPLNFDVTHQFPLEYKVALYDIDEIYRHCNVRLPEREADGIAVCIVNNVLGDPDAAQNEITQNSEHILNAAISIIEKRFHIKVDRQSFDYARLAAHIQYLCERIGQTESVPSGYSGMHAEICQQYPASAGAVDELAPYVEDALGCALKDEERLYLVLHFNRILSRESPEQR